MGVDAVGEDEPMDSSEDTPSHRSNPRGNPVKDVIRKRYLETVAGRSGSAIKPVLFEWIDELDIESFDDIDRDLCRDYGLYLNEEVKDDDRELSARTAHTYWDYVRAFLSFAVRDGHIHTNPAKRNDADEFLPDIEEQVDRQFWTTKQRNAALEFCDSQVDSALTPPKAPEEILLERFRVRAIVAVLGLTGVRGAEVFAVSGDDRRNGITWRDVDPDGNTITVRGKVKREDRNPFEPAQLPDRAANVLERYRRVYDPPSIDWPVFPTNHYPSKRGALKDDFGDDRVDRLLDETPVDEALREYDVPPPALSTEGARTVLKRLTKRLDPLYDCVEYDPEENVYLKPHGARRGLGHELYRKGHLDRATQSLRHGSAEVTKESYQDVQAQETAKDVGEILDDG